MRSGPRVPDGGSRRVDSFTDGGIDEGFGSV